MCGRYGLTNKLENLTGAWAVDVVLTDHEPRFNIAPTQDAPVLVRDRRGRRGLAAYRWGLVPRWADDVSVGNRLVNARSESVAETPAFRAAWAAPRRCLVLATGFYEWRAVERGRGPKQPYWIELDDGTPFGLAGLWERWGPKDAPLRSFTILTTDANALVRPVHDRMPVVLTADAAEAWIDPDVPPEVAGRLLRPFPSSRMRAVPVSTWVNDPRNEGPRCTEPLDEVERPGAPPSG